MNEVSWIPICGGGGVDVYWAFVIYTRCWFTLITLHEILRHSAWIQHNPCKHRRRLSEQVGEKEGCQRSTGWWGWKVVVLWFFWTSLISSSPSMSSVEVDLSALLLCSSPLLCVFSVITGFVWAVCSLKSRVLTLLASLLNIVRIVLRNVSSVLLRWSSHSCEMTLSIHLFIIIRKQTKITCETWFNINSVFS